MAIDIITNPPQIGESEFKELVKDLIENSISGDTSPFNEIREMLTEELDNATDLDASQKAGIYSDFLRDTFTDINKQSMQMAMELLKTNEDLNLKTYSIEAEYNLSKQKEDNMLVEQGILNKDLQVKDAEIALANEKVYESQMAQKETRAKLKKQYGVVDTVTYTTPDDGKTYAIHTDNRWYETNSDGTWVLDGNQDKIPMLVTGQTPIVQELQNTVNPGAIDKQIEGYDKVNYKDLLKTYNENLSMLSNAQVAPPPWMIDTTKLLTEMVTDGKINIDGKASAPTGEDSGELVNDDATTVSYSSSGSEPGV